MPSPFPGMDPYLEGNWWTSIHHDLATMIVMQLAPKLRPKYIAMPERKYIRGTLEEVWISPSRLIPDVGVRRTKSVSSPPLPSGTAVLDTPHKLRTKLGTSVPHFRVEIRDVAKRRLVTAIELLSPTNKGSGRREYLRKRERFLRSSAHLMEIDLHHQGKRIPLIDPYPPGAYFVLLNRARKRSWTDVWPAAIDQALPTVPVPLLKGDADVPLDLQEAFTKVYDGACFDLAVDYRKPPDVELPPEEMAWVKERLRKAGFRQ